jgi:hypothetical protein
VEVFADNSHFLFVFESAGFFAEGIVLMDADIVPVLGVVFECGADAYPGFGDGLVDVREIGDVGLDGLRWTGFWRFLNSPRSCLSSN